MKHKREEYNMREFLSRTVTGIASAGILGISGSKLLSSEKEKVNKKLFTVHLVKQGLKCPL